MASATAVGVASCQHMVHTYTDAAELCTK